MPDERDCNGAVNAISDTRSPIPLVGPGTPGLVVGHRGNSAGAPENTLASEVSAARVGAQVLEFDLQMTADNVPVLIHDDLLDRTTDGTGAISSLTAEQMRTLDAGSSYSPAFAGVGVPTFEEVLRFARTTECLILPELKEANWATGQIRIVAEMISSYGMTDRTMFQSFHPEILVRSSQVAPDISRAGLVSEIPADPVGFVKGFAGQGLLPDYTEVTPGLVATLHAAGLSIIVWTVEDPADWASLTAMGVDGIMSDNPGALAGWKAGYLGNRAAGYRGAGINAGGDAAGATAQKTAD